MLAVSTILASALRVTTRQTVITREMQETVNRAVTEDYTAEDAAGMATFRFTEPGGDIDVSICDVPVFGGMNFTAFMPPLPEEGPYESPEK